jgi:membrane protein
VRLLESNDYILQPRPKPAKPKQAAMRTRELRAFLHLLGQRFAETRCQQVAGSLAFTTLLSLVPLLTLSIVMFGHFPAFAQLGEALKLFVVQNLLPDKAGKIITTYAFQFSQNATKLTLLGSMLFALAAIMLMLTIDRVFNQIWSVRRPRRLAVRIPVYWMVLTVGPLVLAGAIVASSYLVSISLGRVDDAVWLHAGVLRAVTMALFGSFFALLYYAIPNQPVRPRHAALGGLVAAALLALVQRAFSVVVASMPGYTLIYGTFAALPIFLIWLYLSWVVVLLGALVAATLPRAAERRRTLPHFPGDQAFAAGRMLLLLAQAYGNGGAVACAALYDAARLPGEEADSLLESMRDAGWLARSDGGEWLLVRDPARLGTAEIYQRFALASDELCRHAPDGASQQLAATAKAGLTESDRSLAALVDTQQG